MKPITLIVRQEPGRCRWCQCTHERPCPEGCGWANAAQTLCTACADFDRLIRSQPGRRQLAELVQEQALRD